MLHSAGKYGIHNPKSEIAKKILRIAICGAIFSLLFAVGGKAKAASEMNSLTYFIGQQESSQTISGGTNVETIVTSLQNFTFFLGDDAQFAKGVFFEISGVSASANPNTINVSIDDSTFAQARAKSFTLNSNGRETPFKFLYDATTYIDADIQRAGRGMYGPYTLNIKSSTASSMWAVRMVIVYKHNTPSSSGLDEMNSLTYFIGQQESSQTISGGTNVETIVTSLQNFTFFLGDDAQFAKGVFFEISGVSASANPNTINVSIDDSTFAQARAKSFTLNSNGRETPFKFLYDATTYIDADIQRAGRGMYGPYTLNIKSSTASSMWAVRMVITYKHKPGGGGGGPIPAEGWYESPVFEATTGGETSGIKSGFNTLGWTEVRPVSTTVQFQIASSDSSGGPWAYYGPDGLTSSYYDYSQSNYCTGGSGTYTCRISPDHNNKQYFRYKIHLCNENGCGSGTAGNSTPQVEKVILNWSP